MWSGRPLLSTAGTTCLFNTRFRSSCSPEANHSGWHAEYLTLLSTFVTV